MNDMFVPAAGLVFAERAKANRQSGSPANRSAHDFFGIFFVNSAGCKAVHWRIQARRPGGKIIFQKSLVSLARRVKLALPNENWAPRRVTAI
jgi:hypothetical protein